MSKNAIDGTIVHDTDAPAQDAVSYASQRFNTGLAEHYWTDVLVSCLPFVLMLVFVLWLSKRAGRRQTDYYAKYDQSVDTQQKAYRELQNMNKLLAQIVEKLDKK